MTQYVIYRHLGFLPYYEVRRWYIGAEGTFWPDPVSRITTSLSAARQLVPDDFVCVPRTPQDAPTIYEVWI